MYSCLEGEAPPARLEGVRVVGRRIVRLEETDSTNNRALESMEDGTVFVAERQSAGRGRRGRRWHSAPELGLWFSVALDGPLPGLTFAAALAMRDAAASCVALSVKWPNDVCYAGRKVCGILVEQRNHRIALGIGVNVNHQQEDFPPSLRHCATSLSLAVGAPWDREAFLRKLLLRLDESVAQLRRGEGDLLRMEWIRAIDIVGKRIRRGALTGCVTAVEPDGALLVQSGGSLHRVACGDVSLLSP